MRPNNNEVTNPTYDANLKNIGVPANECISASTNANNIETNSTMSATKEQGNTQNEDVKSQKTISHLSTYDEDGYCTVRA